MTKKNNNNKQTIIKVVIPYDFITYIYIYIDTLYRHSWLLHNGLTSVGNA